MELFLDSGAFSAYSKKQEINIYDYIKFIKKHSKYIDVYANLDVIGDGEASYKNQLIMEKHGLKPIPCYHLDDDFELLKKYVYKYDYIGLGGMASNRLSRVYLPKLLDRCWSFICDTKDDKPKVKVHGFAVTSFKLLFRYPWYSVDSTSWNVYARYGCILIPKMKNAKWDYTQEPLKIFISNRSPAQKEVGEHFKSMTKRQQSIIISFLKSEGIKLGKSKLKEVKEGYKLKDNELWWNRKKLIVEDRIELGVINDREKRNLINISYYNNLEKYFKPWPWPFALKKRSLI